MSSSRRDLKKEMTKKMGELYADCIFYKVHVIGANRKAARKIIFQIVELHDDFVSRISVKEGKEVEGRVKAYFKKLREDFNTEIATLKEELVKLNK